ncbi:MAG: nuclear transport factor 2 family protein [Gammaproteobacteria bacterium]|nr:nuclear transport factor 2 family protein [Gammaproteobacteria bacterium]
MSRHVPVPAQMGGGTGTGSAARLLETAKASPAAVAVHDRAGWLALYASDGLVNDPVGSRPHVGRAALERFYDTFIAPNAIRFRSNQDLVCGSTVVRDVTIQTTMPSGLRLDVPAHLLYEIAEEGGALRIRRLYAHWELLPMVGQALRTGFKGLWTFTALSGRMLARQGLGGVFGFMRGFFGVGRAGKRRAQALLGNWKRGDAAWAAQQLEPDATVEVAVGGDATLAELVSRLRLRGWTKMLAAGRTVTASLTLEIDGQARRGVVLLRFDRSPKRISALRVYVES